MTDLEARNMLLAKAGFLSVQAAYYRIILLQESTYEGLRARIENNISDLHNMADEAKVGAQEYLPDRN